MAGLSNSVISAGYRVPATARRSSRQELTHRLFTAIPWGPCLILPISQGCGVSRKRTSICAWYAGRARSPVHMSCKR